MQCRFLYFIFSPLLNKGCLHYFSVRSLCFALFFSEKSIQAMSSFHIFALSIKINKFCLRFKERLTHFQLTNHSLTLIRVKQNKHKMELDFMQHISGRVGSTWIYNPSTDYCDIYTFQLSQHHIHSNFS